MHRARDMNIGARFAKWGLGLFIFGVFLTFGVIAHYCVGARWPTGELFMQNISLWWACPLSSDIRNWTHFDVWNWTLSSC